MFGRRKFDPNAFIPPAPALDDCDLEAQQRQKIVDAGYKNPTKEWGHQWKDETGTMIPPSVYM